MFDLPTLFKKTSTGAIQTWHITVNGSTIVTTYGQLNGKLQVAEDRILTGKNIGKANETTAEEQAWLEAKSQWEKKLKKNYVQTIEDASDEKVDENFITGGINPMLAQPFSKHGHKISFPAFIQPKLDGHRCIAVIEGGKATLWSRTRKPITGVPHIIETLDSLHLSDVVLDGELYNHDYRNNFEDLTSFIKRPDPKPGHEVVQYHVYDVVTDQTFVRRLNRLISLISSVSDPIRLVDTRPVVDEDEAMDAFNAYLSQGFEGAMLRNSLSPYVNKRSYDLQKVKEFDDAEFEIVGVEEGRGKMAGKGIFVCQTDEGSLFRVKMKGNLDSLNAYLMNPDKWIGQLLTVQYQGITNDSKVPRFPIGIRIREDV